MTKNATLRNKILSNSKLIATVLSESMLFEKHDPISTTVPLINVALSGKVNGGLLPGVLMIAGPSKNFKTAFGLLMVSAFLNKHADGVVIFYDSEFGSNPMYFETFGIDTARIVHIPITNAEEWRHDIASQLKELTDKDRVMIFVDSIGNLASQKEVMDAEEGHDKADFTRAKTLKSVFRIIGPHLSMKGIPMVVINHTYKEIGLYPKDIVSGGTGSYYNSNDIWIVGRQQEKDGTELQGYNFIINIEKSRTVKEKSKFPINVTFEHGILKYSGLFDLALEAGIFTSPSKGRYEYNGVKGYRKDFDKDQLWELLLTDKPFLDFIERKYMLGMLSKAEKELA
jgi:RecA/RadA recombinase